MKLLRSYLERHADRGAEIVHHERLEANRQHLIAIDPDAARILTINFTQVLDKPENSRAIADIAAAYCEAKHAAGRMDLYYRLFAGTE